VIRPGVLTMTALWSQWAPAGPDAYGDQVAAYAAPVPVPCWAEQTAETDSTAGETRTVATAAMWCAHGPAIGAHDRIEVLGRTWEVSGPPRVLTAPRATDQVSHIEIPLREVIA